MLGKRLAELRRNRNITQKHLAEILKMSQATIGMWETGKRDPDSHMLALIATIFGVSVDYLVGLSNTRGQLQMTFDQTELLLLLEILSSFQMKVHDDATEREIRALKEKIKNNFKKV